MRARKMRGYVQIDGKTLMYTLEATLRNIAHFIMAQPANVDNIAITDLKNHVICTTMGQFLDWVPAQELVPHLHKHIIPLQRGEAEPDITLSVPQEMTAKEWGAQPVSTELPDYLFMKETALTLETTYSKPIDVHLYVSSYEDNGRLFIGLLEDGEPWGDITVNVSNANLTEKYQAVVKSYNEAGHIEAFIEKHALGAPTGITVKSGYVTMPVYSFDRERLLELSVNGVTEYEKPMLPGEQADMFDGMDAVRLNLNGPSPEADADDEKF